MEIEMEDFRLRKELERKLDFLEKEVISEHFQKVRWLISISIFCIFYILYFCIFDIHFYTLLRPHSVTSYLSMDLFIYPFRYVFIYYSFNCSFSFGCRRLGQSPAEQRAGP